MSIILLFIFLTMQTPANLYSFTIPLLNSSEELELSQFKGKKLLIVNVASRCGYTPQYEDLQAFYEQYKDKVVVIGFPCNQFGNQESGSEQEIAQFCKINYGVTFPITKKIEVKGTNVHEIYQWLTDKDKNGKGDFKVTWNFNKFLIDESGELMAHFGSGVNPFDEEILKYLK